MLAGYSLGGHAYRPNERWHSYNAETRQKNLTRRNRGSEKSFSEGFEYPLWKIAAVLFTLLSYLLTLLWIAWPLALSNKAAKQKMSQG